MLHHHSNFDCEENNEKGNNCQNDCNSDFSFSSCEIDHDIMFRDIETNRTSMTSSDWAEDACELDILESKKVQDMFDHIENMLYFEDCSPAERADNNTPIKLPLIHVSKTQTLTYHNYYDSYYLQNATESPTYRIRQECECWREKFPHLKILGQSFLSHPPQEFGYSFHLVEDSSSIVPHDSPTTSRTDQEHSSLMVSGFQMCYDNSGATAEEIFEQEGIYEDFIAIDTKIIDSDAVSTTNHAALRRGLPPVTPNAVIRSGILNTLFDIFWNEIISWMRPLLQESINSFNKELSNSHKESPYSSTTLPHYSMGKLVQENANLSGLLQISSKTLQSRDRSSQFHDFSEPATGRAEAMSRNFTNTANPSVLDCNSQRNFSDRKAPSRLSHMHGRLAPLELAPLEGDQIGFVRGRSIMESSPLNHHHNNNAAPGGGVMRSGTLPPLDYSHSVYGQPNSILSIQNNPSRTALKKGLSFGVCDSRPSTTQTWRSDAPGAPLAMSYPLNSRGGRTVASQSHKWPFSLHSTGGGGGGGSFVSNRSSIVVMGHRPLTQTEEDDEGESEADSIYHRSLPNGGATNETRIVTNHRRIR